MKYFFFILSFISFPFYGFSQKDKDIKIKQEKECDFDYGKISKEDLDMKFYPLDSSAEAVILTAKAETSIDFRGEGNPEVIRKTLKRIKFFKKSAFDTYGKVQLSFSAKTSDVDLRYIKGAVIQPNGTRQELTKKDFIEENTSSERATKKFTFPNLSEGCIIEYEFEKVYKNISKLPDWAFQGKIPVRHSELWLNLSDYLEYVSLTKGTLEIKRKTFPPTYKLGSQTQVVKLYLDSVPALKEESYTTTMDDYLSQVDFYLKRINYPSGRTEDRLSTWPKVATYFVEHKYMGEQYLSKGNYDDLWKSVKPLVADLKSDSEKIQLIYDYLCKNIDWQDDNYSFYSESLNDAFKKKKASSGELNLMMVACLKEAKIKAFPMLVSTRSNGKAITTYPIADQFNHAACYIDRGEHSIIADVGSSFRPLGIPRIETLNAQGWVLEKDNPRWVKIAAPTSATITLSNFKLDSLGVLKGNIYNSFSGYAALSERGDEEEKHEKIKKALGLAYPDIKIDSINTQNLKNASEPFKRKIYCEIPNAAISANNLMYIKPTLKTDFDENPFKLPTREYPIEFPYPIKDQFIINLSIPDGYVVDEMPKSVKLALPNDGGTYSYISSVKDNLVQLVVKTQITQLVYMPIEYTNVKEFFSQIAAKSTEQIVLKKVNSEK